MLFADLVATSDAVAATRSRRAKVAALAATLRAASPGEADLVGHYLAGSLRQRRTGVGWRSLQDPPAPAASASLTLADVDEAFEAMASLAGPGSQTARGALLGGLFGRATASEQRHLAGLAVGEVRQGALDGLLLEAVAEASGIDPALVRRASMLAGSTPAIVGAALAGGAAALAEFDLRVGTPVRPMLASSAPTVAEGLVRAAGGRPCAVEAKLDGVRIQVHAGAGGVRVFTRSLDDVTARMPEVVAAVAAVAASGFVLDGEALSLGADGRPRPFQDTASRAASGSGGLTPWFFDVLALEGVPTIDLPLERRRALLAERVPPEFLVDAVVTAEPAEADAFARRVLAAGHEGVVVKDLEAPYDAGRRGAGWVKVKPVHTLDLVVLAVEWGSGRRRGLLSNIHLGARDPASGGFVMLGKTFEGTGSLISGWVPVGKTFKGMTDEMLVWQTDRFRALQVADDGHVVTIRPEQVVEIAFDGVQRSSRYPGGVALRFARVVRYRDDKTAAEADTIEAVRSFLS